MYSQDVYTDIAPEFRDEGQTAEAASETPAGEPVAAK
jgi:hypothetical protein